MNLDHPDDLLTRIDFATGSLSGRPVAARRLSDLRGCFHDPAAYETALAEDDRLLYTVCSVTPADGPGNLHYGLGILHPGKIGDEYHLTKGHYHSRREAAEIYIGLRGRGMMLLEEESTRASRMLPLDAGAVVYVPGHTAHRTVNVGDEPLVYLGVYPWNAGHDYGAIAERNFLKVIVERDGLPVMEDR